MTKLIKATMHFPDSTEVEFIDPAGSQLEPEALVTKLEEIVERIANSDLEMELELVEPWNPTGFVYEVLLYAQEDSTDLDDLMGEIS